MSGFCSMVGWLFFLIGVAVMVLSFPGLGSGDSAALLSLAAMQLGALITIAGLIGLVGGSILYRLHPDAKAEQEQRKSESFVKRLGL